MNTSVRFDLSMVLLLQHKHTQKKNRNRCVCSCWSIFQLAAMMDDCTPYGLDCPVNTPFGPPTYDTSYNIVHLCIWWNSSASQSQFYVFLFYFVAKCFFLVLLVERIGKRDPDVIHVFRENRTFGIRIDLLLHTMYKHIHIYLSNQRKQKRRKIFNPCLPSGMPARELLINSP